MFRRVRNVLAELTKKVSEVVSYRELTEEDFERVFSEIGVKLIEGDVAYDVVEELREVLKKELVGIKVSRFRASASKEVVARIKEGLLELLERGLCSKDLVRLVSEGPKPYVVVFLGVNGVGKTTTIAKVAYSLKGRGFKVVMVAADTFRAGAQEQLRLHAERLGVPFIMGKYGADPAAVAKDGVIYAEKHGIDAVLIDTAGRMHTDSNLVDELRKVVRVVKPNLKVLVLDALTGNDAVQQSVWFDRAVGVDVVILTKLDADAGGGSALSVILAIGKPIMYVGVGQRYSDLLIYRPNEILNKLLSQ
ncbi:MAG: signal recognition particle-docking protein FtsY [Desulfurococcales archaeon ex4484_204]|nr:MAG: signal recognition particle-docking protein FtsY [Desulfurococcales archaeon ex4484_204]